MGVDDAELLRAMFAEHGDALYAHALRLTNGDRQRAEDLVQETLLRAWRHPEALDPNRGSVRAWLFTTARNLAIEGRLEKVRYLLHDRDAKFSGAFDAILRCEDVR